MAEFLVTLTRRPALGAAVESLSVKFYSESCGKGVLPAIVHVCPNVTRLSLTDALDVELVVLNKLRHLNRLELVQCHFTTDAVVELPASPIVSPAPSHKSERLTHLGAFDCGPSWVRAISQ